MVAFIGGSKRKFSYFGYDMYVEYCAILELIDTSWPLRMVAR